MIHEDNVKVVENFKLKPNGINMNIIKEITNDFCGAFCEEKDYTGPVSRLIADGYFPDGVDQEDIRVQNIQKKCKEKQWPKKH